MHRVRHALRQRSAWLLASVLLAATSASAQDTVFDVWYGDTQEFGALGNPQVWVNVLGNVQDPQGIQALTFSLNGGPQQFLTVGPNQKRLYFAGDFNVEIAITDLVDGTNTILLEAEDGLGNLTQKTVLLEYDGGNVWPLPYTADWGSASAISDVAQVVDGKWELTPGGGLRTLEVGYDRVVAIGDLGWVDYQATVPFTIHDLDESAYESSFSGSPTLALYLRWNGHTEQNPGEQPHHFWEPNGAAASYDYVYERYVLDGDLSLPDRQPATPPTLGQLYYWKVRVQSQPGGETAYAFKWWADGTPEPASWLLETTEPAGDLPSGSLILVAHHVDVTFGNVVIEDLGSVDDPPVILNPRVTNVGDTQATIEWDTNEPATSQVAYGTTSGYELGVVGSPSVYSTTHSVQLSGLTPDQQYHFQIQSADVGGNVGTTSDDTFSTTGGGPSSSVVSDDFSQTALSSIWTFVDPLGDSSMALTGTQLEFSLGTGSTHDIWTGGIQTPHIVQSIPNEDFEVEAKFESSLTQDFQSLGILVKQDADDLLRLEVHRTNAPKVYAAKLVGGSASTIAISSIPSGDAPIHLRVLRMGDDWTLSYSLDGIEFVQTASFNHPLTVSEIGLFAGNSAGTPHTALVDYFFNTASPIDPEDEGGSSFVLNLSAQGSGALTRDPAQSSYAPGSVVELTATPDPGWVFDHWEQDLSGSQNPIQLTVNDDTDVTAVFVPDGSDTTPPAISNVQWSANPSSATITWTTDENADSTVSYGTVSGSLGSSASDTALVTNHSIAIGPLVPDTTYFFEVGSTDASANSASDGEHSFITPETPPNAGVQSDGFDGGGLDTGLWTFENPLGDASVSTNGSQLVLDIPASENVHDVWSTSNTLPRIMQDVSDGDFQVQVKLDSEVPTAGSFRSYGILVEETPTDVIRAELHRQGSTLKFFVATIFDGSASIKKNQSVALATPRHLQITRLGDEFTVEYSEDGTTWLGGVTFTQPMTMTRIGPYTGSGSGDAQTAQIDHFLPEPRGPASLAAGALLLLTLARLGRRRTRARLR